jgi:hypothetical protein
MTDDPNWFAGVDWASETHQATLLNDKGKVIGERAFPHGGAGLAAMCDWLLATADAPAEKIAVAIEVPHGPVVETLLERGFPVHALTSPLIFISHRKYRRKPFVRRASRRTVRSTAAIAAPASSG